MGHFDFVEGRAMLMQEVRCAVYEVTYKSRGCGTQLMRAPSGVVHGGTMHEACTVMDALTTITTCEIHAARCRLPDLQCMTQDMLGMTSDP